MAHDWSFMTEESGGTRDRDKRAVGVGMTKQPRVEAPLDQPRGIEPRLDQPGAVEPQDAALAVDSGNEEALVRREIVELGIEEPAPVARKASPLATELHVPAVPTDPDHGLEVNGCH